MTPNEGDAPGRMGDGGSRPVPDPTVLTTEALTREINALREALSGRIDALAETLDTYRRYEHQAMLDHDAHLRELAEHEFRFNNRLADERMSRLDERRDAQQEALKAALAAQKEAVEKTELRVDRQIEATGKQIETGLAALADKVDSIGSRVERRESGELGEASGSARVLSSRDRVRAGWIGLALIVIAAAGVIVTILGSQP